MSQSPSLLENYDSAKTFQAAQRKLTRLIRDGMSFSGHERNCVFLNLGARTRFANISGASGFDFLDDGRGVALTDWDHDGDLDIWVTNRTAPQTRFLRNENSNGNRYVMLRLRGDGKSTNRDAIGARVTLQIEGSTRPLIATLRAGEGYISQNTKWLHFGLDRGRKLQSVSVRWPGGETEDFHGVEPNERYLLLQGAALAERVKPREDAPALEATALERPPTTTVSRTWFSKRVYWPRFDLNDSQGKAITLGEASGKPTLVNLWASWCLPCRKEFHEWDDHYSHLQTVGLRIIALSVDAITRSKADPPLQDLELFRKQTGVPFTLASVTQEQFSLIEAFYKTLFHRHPRLPVPTSFLLDGQGRLAAMYRGPVSSKQLLKDIQLIDAPREQWLFASLPFEGRSYRKLSGLSSAFVANDLAAQGLIDEAVKYLRDNVEYFVRAFNQGVEPLAFDAFRVVAKAAAKADHPSAAEILFDQAIRLKPSDADGHFEFGMLYFRSNKKELAAAKFREALNADPKRLDAKNHLALSLAATGDIQQALKLYREALRDDPNHVKVLNNLGNTLAELKQLDVAIEILQKAVTVAPNDAPSHYNLGAAYDARGEYREAMSYYRQAIQLDSRHARAHHNLGVNLARLGQLKEAETLLRRATELDATYELAKRNLQRILEARRERNSQDQ